MTESLFPNPPRPPRARRRRRVPPDEACCVEWMHFVAERAEARKSTTRVEAFVHRLGHSRTPFSAVKVMDLTDCSNLTAARAIQVALDHGWVYPLVTYSEQDPPLFGGKL